MQGYDPKIITHFEAMLVSQKVRLMAYEQRNGNPILVEELISSERNDRPEIVARHDAEMIAMRRDLADINLALDRCRKGVYGLCVDCGESILLARLEAIPTASRCVSCQKKHVNGATAAPSVSDYYFVKKPW